jgi:hypothetical protein
MINMSKSGTAEQSQCLKVYCEYLVRKKHKIIGTFLVRKMRVPTRYGYRNMGEDIFGKDGLGFDMEIASHYKHILVYTFIQVRSVYSRKDYLQFVSKWKDSTAHVWLAVYQKNQPRVPYKELAALGGEHISKEFAEVFKTEPLIKGSKSSENSILMQLGKFWFLRIA